MGFLFEINSTICGFLYGALIQVCVMFGVHWGFVALNVNNMATLGYDAITIAGLASAFAQVGVVLMIMLKTKNKKEYVVLRLFRQCLELQSLQFMG